MSTESRLQAAEKLLDVGSGVLWDDVSLSQFVSETSVEDGDISPGSARLNLYITLVSAPNMLVRWREERLDWFDEWLEMLGLTEDQCDRESIDAACFELARAAGFNKLEMQRLRKELTSQWRGIEKSRPVDQQHG